ncbi:hypothetical protein HY29_15115 [Hyphomonas beringensis]|uniref:Uncharacterized protein n=1 Tax=Hyphomonas beringensis TaxID=1280946 RepID=A0A062UCF3_9PROT|nr:hypothetical protein [Hyphomonas beringensis]KCZ54259.1 hypothetical protein HY29_15115 [Hyphomonas beringensis]
MTSLSFPIAKTLQDALKPDAQAARTRAQAEAIAEGEVIQELAVDWLNVTEEEATAYFQAANSEETPAQGYLQRYEDNEGKPVLAVTWWKIADPKALKAKAKKAVKEKPATEEPPVEDHTDDLYFRSGRTKPRRKRYIDPRQMDLFKKS